MRNNEIEQARSLAKKWHSGQSDKAGRPYIEHLEHVSETVQPIAAKVTALLHDILEDTACTVEELNLAGFGDDIVDAVIAITHRDNEPYDAYIARVKNNELARMVKIADMEHNSDLSRLQSISKKDLERKEKYTFYLAVLID